MSENTLYWEFDDRNPAFVYGPGWLNLTDVNAHESTLSYTSEKTNVTIQFYGKTLWLFGAIGRTEDWKQPVSRYTLDNLYVSTIVAEAKNETSYNELFAYFYNLDSSYHTLTVENINEDATLFLDYYLVEPMPPDQSTKSTGNLQTGGKPFSTSISERPILAKTANLSGNAAIGSLIGAVIGGILLAFFVAIIMFFYWRRRGGSMPYYYKPAAVHDVLFDVEAGQERVKKRFGNFYGYTLPLFPLYHLRYTAKYSAISPNPDEDHDVSK
ncbi:hypothetical protein BDM02DRAFT_3127223 [Thelephora ganbajun]|uniref:Uncharacterized protein n=1 Tax=Thelephora ganbajun TaxID=370292 RepID=A0ACB6ZNI4_THEGA|nr:hypothetical protein BDM02DRAFT_3127223 [Thelephora ganbajun]